MKKLALFTLLSLMTLQTNYTYSSNNSFSNNLRAVSLSLTGLVITYVALTTLKNIVDKIIEENTGINEESLRSKCINALRYTFGFSVSTAAMFVGLFILLNSDKNTLQ